MNGFKRAFSLIELLVVVAVIAVLATISLVTIDPAKKTKQARDASRKSSLAQIAGALANYVTLKDSYPKELADLVPVELTTVPRNPSLNDFFYEALDENGGVCLTANKTCRKAVVYDTYESPKNACPPGEEVYWGWTSSSGRLGLICSPSRPVAEDLPVDDL